MENVHEVQEYKSYFDIIGTDVLIDAQTYSGTHDLIYDSDLKSLKRHNTCYLLSH